MALKTNKSISLTGTSTIGDVQVAYLNATLDQEGNGANTVNQSIQNQTLYDANKKEVRADIAKFQQLLYDTEDSLTSEKKGTDSSKTSEN
ncbi:hypothetical protein GRZ59_05280 [Lactobacillus paracasei]|uniref:hypothetical protein n=1 Tax=Lacticaseibacillus paracasei TaxID=1597 RepID=UPI0013720CBC|nr:hypothetical protein [Lacticaseibacillus paracasei]MXI83170.1 hypothetical protein [Lacticaseibacillus paracasei]